MDEMHVAIEGIGVVGGFGSGTKSLREALSTGRPTVSSLPLVHGSSRGTKISAIVADTGPLERFIPKRNLRRVDHYSKLALLGASLALEDAGIGANAAKDMGVVIATGYGPHRTTFAFLDSFLGDGDALSSPTQFTHSVHNAAAAHISIQLGLTGPALTVGQFETSVASALLTACCHLEQGQVRSILFGAVDEYSDVLGYCWQRLFGQQPDDASMRPFDFERQSAIPGEGAAFFVLTRHPEKTPYGFLTSVTTGHADLISKNETVPDDPCLLVGADGHLDTAPRYSDLCAGRDAVPCYTPLYGSLPTGQAFDLAVAALTLREGVLFPNPEGTARLAPSNGTAQVSLSGKRIWCVKYGRRDQFGAIAIES